MFLGLVLLFENVLAGIAILILVLVVQGIPW